MRVALADKIKSLRDPPIHPPTHGVISHLANDHYNHPSHEACIEPHIFPHSAERISSLLVFRVACTSSAEIKIRFCAAAFVVVKMYARKQNEDEIPGSNKNGSFAIHLLLACVCSLAMCAALCTCCCAKNKMHHLSLSCRCAPPSWRFK